MGVILAHRLLTEPAAIKLAWDCLGFLLASFMQSNGMLNMRMVLIKIWSAAAARMTRRSCVQVYQAIGSKEVSIGAWIAEGRGWKLQAQCEPRIKFSMTGALSAALNEQVKLIAYSSCTAAQ